MALIDDVRTTADAIADLQSWSTDFTAVADPLRRAARVMAAMAAVMAQVIETQARAVQAVSNRMNVINEILKQVNEGITRIKNQGDDTTNRRWLTGTQEELQAVLDIMDAEGVQLSLFASPVPTEITLAGDPDRGLYEIIVTGRNLTTVQTNLQTSLESLSSTSQSDQARVQTTLGRYNATFDLVSSLVKKSESQGDTVASNLRT